MTVDFDAVVDRCDTSSDKRGHTADRDIIPMWGGDMDFRASPPVLEALHRRVDPAMSGQETQDAQRGKQG